MKSKFILLLLFVVHFSFAQTGNYFLSQYAPDAEQFDYSTFSIAQDEKGEVYFANKKGVIEFDGRNWNLVSTSSPIFTLAANGFEIFAGGYKGFGKLIVGENHNKIYQSLSDNIKDATEIFSSLSLNGKVYFANAHSIFVLSTNGKIEATIKSKPQQEFFGLLEITGNVFIKSSEGIFKIEENKLSSPSFPWTDDLSIEFASTSTSPTNKLTVLSVSGGRLFLASSTGLKEINLADKDFLIRNVPVNVAWVNDDLIAVGTLRGGVIFVNAQTGATQEITNYRTGLPSNEVLALMTDRNQGLWVAHNYGFTRIAPIVPFKSYSFYDGLEGNLLCARTYHGQIYVGTSLGLFYLTKQEVVENVPIDKPTISTQSKKKNAFVRRNLYTEKSSSTEHTVKRTTYKYQKVIGIDGQVNQLIETNEELLAAGDFGLASVNENQSTLMITAPVRYGYLSKALNQLLVSTDDDKVLSFQINAKKWNETKLLDTLNEEVSYVFEDKLQNIWLCGRTNAVKIETVDGEITSMERVPFANPSLDESVGFAMGSEAYIATSGSFHRYNEASNSFKKYDSLPGPKKCFASAGNFWFHDGHRWRTVDTHFQKLEWLGLFSSLRYIAPEDKENLWVITSNNELYKFSMKQASTDQKGYPLFLREVRGQQKKFAPSHSIIVSQLESTVSFDFIQPDYLGMRAIEYRYQIKGRNSDWTPWSTSNNIVNFSYLPAGKYKLDIQTRDLMGKISAAEEITLQIVPPYWKQSWFYLIEVIFFGSMVFLSMRLSAGNAKYRIVSQLLSMLTVIMIIQLVQAAVSSQLVAIKISPVIDFFIQVGIALLVLPIENYLRKFIRRTPKE